MRKSYQVQIYPDKATGTYWGTVPEIRGCNTQGDTVDEVMENIKEAIELCLRPVPGEITRTVTIDLPDA